MPKQMGYEMRFKTKPVEVEAFQFTEQLRDAIILDGAEYPSGVTSGSAEFHRANRKVWHANFYIDDSRKLIALGDWSSDVCSSDLNRISYPICFGILAGAA